MKTLTKYDLRPLFRVNIVDSNGSRGRTVGHVALAYVAPLLAGVGIGLWVHFGLIVENGVSVALPSASLLVGAMFGAFIFLTNLRIKLAESPTFAFRVDLLRLVGSGAASCLYLGLVAVLLAGVLALVGSIPWFRSDAVAPFTVGLLVAISAHIGITLAMVARRLFVIYLSLFASDFNPDVQTEFASDGEPRPKAVREIEPTRRSRKMFRQ
jgi:hypothetical protein